MDFLKGNLSLTLSYVGKANTTGLSPIADLQREVFLNTFVTGAGAGQCNEAYCAVRTLAAGADETLDLYGVLLNNLRQTVNFARIKGILVALLDDTAATSITVGGYGANGWVGPFGDVDGIQTVYNGGIYLNTKLDASGWVVTNSTADKLKILNNDGAVVATYLIALIGALT